MRAEGGMHRKEQWGGKEDPAPSPHLVALGPREKTRLLERWQGEPCPQGAVRLLALECEGSIQDTSDFTDEGSRD